MLSLSTTLWAQVDPNFHIYLCFGQSNMQGSAKIEEQDKDCSDRLSVMAPCDFDELDRDLGKWYKATPPLSHPQAGLSIADYFGREMVALEPDSVRVGLVVVAVSGCDIRLFDKDIYLDYLNKFDAAQWWLDLLSNYGNAPYYRALHLLKLAQKEGVIKGMVLHQGETNTGDKEWPNYVSKVYTDLLEDLDLEAEDVPIVAGEVGHAKQKGKCSKMNPIINTLPDVIPTSRVVSSKDCSLYKDYVHFDSEGVRKFGRRYAETMKQK